MYLSEATRENRNLPVETKTGPKAVTPATVAAIVAAIGTAGLFLMVLGPGNSVEGHGGGMISAAAAHSAGATITPSVPAR